MDRARHPLLLVVYPVLGDLFMMLGMALVWPKLILYSFFLLHALLYEQTPMSFLDAFPSDIYVISSAVTIGCGYALAIVSCFARGRVSLQKCF